MNIDDFAKRLNETMNDTKMPPSLQYEITFDQKECEALKKILEEAKTAEIRLQYIENTDPEIATKSEIAAMILQSPEMAEIAGKITRVFNTTVDLVSEVMEAAGNALAHLVESQIEREGEE